MPGVPKKERIPVSRVVADLRVGYLANKLAIENLDGLNQVWPTTLVNNPELECPAIGGLVEMPVE